MADPALLRSIYADVLSQRLGLPVELDPDDVEDLQFRHGDFTFLLTTGGHADPSFATIRTLFDGQSLNGGQPIDRPALTAVATQTTQKMRLAKVRVTPENTVVFNCDLLVSAPDTLPTPEALVAVLPRTLKILTATVFEMHEQLQLHGIATASTTTHSS